MSRANRSWLWIALWLTAAVNARGAAATNAAPPSAASPSAVLYLNSGFVRGELRDSDKPEVLCWQGTDFVTPFLFDTRQIDAVYFPDPI